MDVAGPVSGGLNDGVVSKYIFYRPVKKQQNKPEQE